MGGPLVVCPSCSTHVLKEDVACPHCDAPLRSGRALGRTAGAVLMGLSLAGCPASDDGDDTMGGSGSSSASSSSDSGPGSSSDPTDPSGTTVDSDPTLPGVTAAAYGGPVTDSFSTTDVTDSDTTSSGGDTDTDTDTDTDGTTGTTGTTGATEGSTTLSPLYGAVPTD